jgi:hypothetical protein
LYLKNDNFLKFEYVFFLLRSLLTESTHQLKALSKKIGVSTIEKARPYYEALEISNKAQKECQAAATAYQRAHGNIPYGLFNLKHIS